MLLLSDCSYRLIEMPWLRRGHTIIARLRRPEHTATPQPITKPTAEERVGGQT